MARTTSQPSTATRRSNRTTQPDTNGLGSLNEQDERDESRQLENDERREGLSAVHNEHDDDRGDSRDERNVSDEDSDGGARRDQRPVVTLAVGMETFAPVLEAWKHVFTSWTELTETMVKAQQETFTSMISAANAHAKDLKHDENRSLEHAFAGSPTTASTPERIDRDRR